MWLSPSCLHFLFAGFLPGARQIATWIWLQGESYGGAIWGWPGRFLHGRTWHEGMVVRFSERVLCQRSGRFVLYIQSFFPHVFFFKPCQIFFPFSKNKQRVWCKSQDVWGSFGVPVEVSFWCQLMYTYHAAAMKSYFGISSHRFWLETYPPNFVPFIYFPI